MLSPIHRLSQIPLRKKGLTAGNQAFHLQQHYFKWSLKNCSNLSKGIFWVLS